MNCGTTKVSYLNSCADQVQDEDTNLCYFLTSKLKNQVAFSGNMEILGRYMWLEISIFMAQILIEGVDKEYLSCALNFETFRNMSKKLWPNM